MSNVIKRFESLTKQAIFNKAVAHIAKTRQKSMDNNGICVYSGSGCAAAPLLTPTGRLLNGGWGQLVAAGKFPPHEAEFISEIQKAHDSSEQHDFIPIWKGRMVRIAMRYGLDYKKVNAIPDTNDDEG